MKIQLLLLDSGSRKAQVTQGKYIVSYSATDVKRKPQKFQLNETEKKNWLQGLFENIKVE